MIEETAVQFPCVEDQLIGVLVRPSAPAAVGVVILVGGPQYRVGSHRQFVHLARSLALQGIAALRFDFRGMGDSSGDARSFEEVDVDIRAAVDCLAAQVPTVRQIILWGLCDGATAAMMYAPSDQRVIGLVAANPWARSSETEARTMITHYYVRRLLSAAFWRKLLTNKVDLKTSASGFAGSVAGSARRARHGDNFNDRMSKAMACYEGKVLFLTCDRDLTAQEFESFARASLRDDRAPRRQVRAWLRFPKADHTFSGAEAARDVAGKTAAWLRASFP